MAEQIFDSEFCIRCKGRGWCNQRCTILSKIKQTFPKNKTHFSGSSPPEVFVGRIGYPHLNTGILSPQEFGDTEEMSLSEKWYEKGLSIKDILNHRGQLIYSRFKSKVLDVRKENPGRFLGVMQEISMADKSVSAEIFLKKPVSTAGLTLDKHLPIIGNPAPLKSIYLQENPHVNKKVDYLVSDTDSKAATSMVEMYKSGQIVTSNIIKILSSGLLGLKKNRRLVPTRWSVTATDDTLSKHLLEKIRFYQELGEIRLFHGYYVGNYYEILLLPGIWSFEVIEAFLVGSAWNPFSKEVLFTQDYEGFNGRKYYAKNVTGAYYTIRLAICEYLEKIKRQASVLIMREERPEYNAPLGVGILRELSRGILKKEFEVVDSIGGAFGLMGGEGRMKLNPDVFRKRSWLLNEYRVQRSLRDWV